MYKKKCKHDEGLHHNCAYVDRVNKLIPAAKREARRRVAVQELQSGRSYSATEFGDLVNRQFFHEMDRLAAKQGRRLLPERN